MATDKGLKVITVPQKMLRQIENFKHLKQRKAKESAMQHARAGNTSIPIITCKNSKLNFYKNQSYSKFHQVPLASQGWKSRKSKGDHFIINKYLENPAFLDTDDGCETFEDLGIDIKIAEELKKHGYLYPTNIQKLSIPHILDGSNTLIAAETGNGKTMAFLAPIFQQILEAKELNADVAFNSPRALVIVPGRELVPQIRDMARVIGSPLGIKVSSIFGGRTKRMMLNPQVGQTDILVASFGCLSKLMTTRIYRRNRISHVVLDEADTLLDDSFNDNVSYFLSKLPIRGQKEDDDSEVVNLSGVQLSLVGATFPTSVRTILNKIMEVDSLVDVRTPFLHRISPHINQTFLRIGHQDKSETLLKLAKRNQRERIPTIIFSNTAPACDWVSLFLNENGVPCTRVNGGMKAMDRVGKFDHFQDEKCYFMSCTDLVSRGLNTVRARHIINYDFPRFMADYIHRCGRTGRVGADENCQVTSFIVNPSEVALTQEIEYAARKVQVLPNVNANIKRIITHRTLKYEAQHNKETEGVEDTKKNRNN